MFRFFRGAALGALVSVALLGLGPAPDTADPSALHSLSYRLVGPTQGGRVTAVAGHRSHPGTFYMGATGGGVWKTDDYGASWYPVSDGYFGTGSIGAIRVARSDAEVVYVGAGAFSGALAVTVRQAQSLVPDSFRV